MRKRRRFMQDVVLLQDPAMLWKPCWLLIHCFKVLTFLGNVSSDWVEWECNNNRSFRQDYDHEKSFSSVKKKRNNTPFMTIVIQFDMPNPRQQDSKTIPKLSIQECRWTGLACTTKGLWYTPQSPPSGTNNNNNNNNYYYYYYYDNNNNNNNKNNNRKKKKTETEKRTRISE